MKKSKFTASDILEQPFNDDSDFFGSDSNEEGEEVYAYWGPTLSTSTLRGGDFGEHFFW